MNRFAELLDRLAYEPGRNNKLRLMTAYFREVEDPDRGYALAALTGALSFKHAKPGLIRDLIADRTDPVLFALSYDYVGDLSETVALMWPKRACLRPSPAAAAGRGGGSRIPRSRSRRSSQRDRSAIRPPRKRRRSRIAAAISPRPSPPRSGARGGRGAHGRPQQPASPHPHRSRHHAAHARQDRAAETARALARRARRDRPLGAAETRHRRDADRDFGAAGQDRGGRARRQGPARYRIDVAGAHAALSRSVRVAGGPRRKAGQSRSRAVPPGDAGACDRGYGFRQSRCRRLHRGMEMGRHPRAGGQRPRRARPHAGAALFAQRRGHHQKLSGSAAVAASAGRHRRRIAGGARRPGAEFQRAAAAAQPQSGLAETDQGLSDPSARL